MKMNHLLVKIHFTLLLLIAGQVAFAAGQAGSEWFLAPGLDSQNMAPRTTAGLVKGQPASAPNFYPPMALTDVCETDNNTFQAGEKITYKLYYNWGLVWLDAGEVVFKVHELPNNYYITVTGTTYESYEWFFKVRDRYESYLDKETLLPELHIKDVQEGGYTQYNRTTFDQTDHVAVSAKGRNRNELTEKTIPFEGCMHDLISTVYWARNLDYDRMNVGQEVPIEIMMNRTIYPLKAKYLGKEANKRVKGVGNFNTHRFSPQLIAGDVFKEGDEMKIWVSDDRNKIPVLIESPVVVGSVKAVLYKYEGLKYPHDG